MQIITFDATDGVGTPSFQNDNKMSTNYFAAYLWPRMKFHEIKFQGDINDVDQVALYRTFLTGLPESLKYPKFQYLLTFTKRHVEGGKGCVIVRERDYQKVVKVLDGQELGLAKRVKYSGLLFNVYERPIMELRDVVVDVVADVERSGYCFTDGCGRISEDLMAEIVAEQLERKAKDVSVIQCRLPGVKGTLVVDPQSPARTIKLSRSMIKLDVLKMLDREAVFGGFKYSKLPIVVLDYSKESHNVYLNNQLIALLMALGVEEKTMYEKKRWYFDCVKFMTLDARYALNFHHFMGHDTTVLMKRLQKSPLAAWRDIESKQRSEVNRWKKQSKDDIKARIQIPVNGGRLLFGICDFTGTLLEGQCYVALSDKRCITGKVAVTRNPCYVPGDVRVLQAVECEKLGHLSNVIVFSVLGSRPAADMMSGGDLDGDKFIVLWEQELVPKQDDVSPFDYRQQALKKVVSTREPRLSEISSKKYNRFKQVEYLLNYGCSAVAQLDALMRKLQYFNYPPSVNVRELRETVNALFSCGIDQLGCFDYRSLLQSITKELGVPESESSVGRFVNDTLQDVELCFEKTRVTYEAIQSDFFIESITKVPYSLQPPYVVQDADYSDVNYMLLWAARKIVSHIVDHRHCSNPPAKDMRLIVGSFEPNTVQMCKDALEQNALDLKERMQSIFQGDVYDRVKEIVSVKDGIDFHEKELISVCSAIEQEKCKAKTFQEEVEALEDVKKEYQHYIVEGTIIGKCPLIEKLIELYTNMKSKMQESQRKLDAALAKLRQTYDDMETHRLNIIQLEDQMSRKPNFLECIFEPLTHGMQRKHVEREKEILRANTQIEMLHGKIYELSLKINHFEGVRKSQEKKLKTKLNQDRRMLQEEIQVKDSQIQVLMKKRQQALCAVTDSTATQQGHEQKLERLRIQLSDLEECTTLAEQEELLSSLKTLEEIRVRRNSFISLLSLIAQRIKPSMLSSLNEVLHSETAMFSGAEKLPIYQQRDNVNSVVEANRVTLIVSETGSGKSTCTPQFLLNDWLLQQRDSYFGKLCVALPRRNATTELSKMLARTRDCTLGRTVGYHIGKKRPVAMKNQTLLECVSYGVLLGRSISDPFFGQFSVIIVDEVHEHSADLYILLGKLKEAMHIHKRLKIVLMSAKVDEEQLERFFGSLEVVRVPGRAFPVESIFCADNRNYFDSAIETVNSIHSSHAVHTNTDILVFLPLVVDVVRAVDCFKDSSDIEAFPLHSRLTESEKSMVLKKNTNQTGRRVIFATNIAEASLTLPAIGFVVDSGVEMIVHRDIKTGIVCPKISNICLTSAEQRKGRSGRLAPGKCFHLYSEKTMNRFLFQKRGHYSDLESNLLRLIQGSSNPFAFEWFHHPGQDNLEFGLNLLIRFGMLRSTHGSASSDGFPATVVTQRGQYAMELLKIGLNINTTQLILSGIQKGIRDDCILLACFIEFFHILISCKEKVLTTLAPSSFSLAERLIKLYNTWMNIMPTKKNWKAKKDWCDSVGLKHSVFVKIEAMRKEILGVVANAKFEGHGEASVDKNVEYAIMEKIAKDFDDEKENRPTHDGKDDRNTKGGWKTQRNASHKRQKMKIQQSSDLTKAIEESFPFSQLKFVESTLNSAGMKSVEFALASTPGVKFCLNRDEVHFYKDFDTESLYVGLTFTEYAHRTVVRMVHKIQ
jgi:HrpA-like RNA helicase